MSETDTTRYEPHVMVDIVDPMKDGLSSTWKGLFYSMLFIEAMHFFAFVWFAKNSVALPPEFEGPLTYPIILENIVWKNVLRCLVILISFVVVPTVWYSFVGTQSKLDYNTEHTRFKIRTIKGIEQFSKYAPANQNNGIVPRIKGYILRRLHLYVNPVDVIISFTGIQHFDRATGLTTEKINEDEWPLAEHPYKGDHGYSILGFVNFDDDDEVMIENFVEATNTLGADYLVSTSMFSGQNTSYIMDDVEEQLKLPGLSPIREKALWSVYNKFKDREGTDEPIFIIHIGLPPAVHDYEHIENMRKARDEYELTINEFGIDTVLIKDAEDLALIINGMLTGEFRMGDINEY